MFYSLLNVAMCTLHRDVQCVVKQGSALNLFLRQRYLDPKQYYPHYVMCFVMLYTVYGSNMK